MIKKKIVVHTIADIGKLVTLASKVESDVVISRGKFSVDGKSLMGVMSIDVSQGCIIEYDEEAKEFDEFVSQFEIRV